MGLIGEKIDNNLERGSKIRQDHLHVFQTNNNINKIHDVSLFIYLMILLPRMVLHYKIYLY